MAAVAWMFRKKFPKVALGCLIAAMVPIAAVAVWEVATVVNPPLYDLRLSHPVPGTRESGQPWGGFYESGASVGQVTVTALKDGEQFKSIEIAPIDFAERRLSVELDPSAEDSMLVKSNSNSQGRILFRTLDSRLRGRIFSGSVKPDVVSYTEEANEIGDRIGVNQASVDKQAFQGLEMLVKQWIYSPEAGVGVDIFVDDERIAEGRVVTRENPLAVKFRARNATIALVTLDLQDEVRKRAKFVLLMYAASPDLSAAR